MIRLERELKQRADRYTDIAWMWRHNSAVHRYHLQEAQRLRKELESLRAWRTKALQVQG
jgi:hypothetical protein